MSMFLCDLNMTFSNPQQSVSGAQQGAADVTHLLYYSRLTEHSRTLDTVHYTVHIVKIVFFFGIVCLFNVGSSIGECQLLNVQ